MMKLKLLILTVLFCTFLPLHHTLMAQDCNEAAFALMKAGSEVHYQVYDKDQELVSITKSKVASVSQENGKVVATIEVAGERVTKKGKEKEPLPFNSFQISCENGKVVISFRSLFSSDHLKQINDMEVEISGTDIELPDKLSPGQQLPDAEAKFSIKMGELSMLGTTITITDRKVEAAETVTTPAGTFNCLRLGYYTDVKMGFSKFKMRTVEWLAPGIGMVKSESYNKKDKLESRTELVFLK